MKTTLLTIAATLALSGAALAEPVKVGIAAEPYPPFASPDAAGNWVGWEVDLIGAVCAAAEMECVITPVAWDGIIPSLTSGQIDAIMASMSITDERMQTIDFSDKYYNTPTVIVGAKGVAMTSDAAGLAGKIIGVQSVHVTCPKCKGQPFLKGKSVGMLQTTARNVSIPDYLPAAQALFERSGAVAVWPEE